MALEVGIVGLPGAGKTTLFTALTRTGGAGFGKENVGMASIADDRLEALATLVGAQKITPASIRVVDVPGTGPALLGGLRQVDAILAVADGFSPGADPASDLETLELSSSSPTATTSSGGWNGSRSRQSRVTPRCGRRLSSYRHCSPTSRPGTRSAITRGNCLRSSRR